MIGCKPDSFIAYLTVLRDLWEKSDLTTSFLYFTSTWAAPLVPIHRAFLLKAKQHAPGNIEIEYRQRSIAILVVEVNAM
jgi:hypothetical protein